MHAFDSLYPCKQIPISNRSMFAFFVELSIVEMVIVMFITLIAALCVVVIAALFVPAAIFAILPGVDTDVMIPLYVE